MVMLLLLTALGAKISYDSSIFSMAEANLLAGKKIVVDPGHGGIDGGTNCYDFLEKEINLAVARKLQKELTRLGAKVVLTRSKDVELVKHDSPTCSRHRGDLLARVSIIEKNKPDIFLSIHVNANSYRPSSTGAIVFYNKQSPGATELTAALQNSLNKVTEKHGFKKHTAQPADYFILRNSTRTGAIIELGFMTNQQEKELLKQDQYQWELTKGIVAGVKDYFSTFSADLFQLSGDWGHNNPGPNLLFFPCRQGILR